MIRSEFGDEKQYCVRYDAYETKVDVVGNLTIEELDELIEVLTQARKDRQE